MKLIIEIPEKTYHMINAGFYDYGDMNLIIQNGTPIPDNATNGEMIKAMFPQMNINEEWKATRHGEIIENEITEVTIAGTSDWWSAPYQKGGKE